MTDPLTTHVRLLLMAGGHITLDQVNAHAPGLTEELRALVLPAEIWGPAEIMAYTGRPKATVQNWYRRGSHNFPQPTWQVSAGPLWDASVVKAWLAEHSQLCTIESPFWVERLR